MQPKADDGCSNKCALFAVTSETMVKSHKCNFDTANYKHAIVTNAILQEWCRTLQV